MEGFEAPGEDFITWSEVQNIFSIKYSPTNTLIQYNVLSFSVHDKHIRVNFRHSNEHVKVVEEIARWLWQKKTAGLKPVTKRPVGQPLNLE
jgi:hypothetical protein